MKTYAVVFALLPFIALPAQAQSAGDAAAGKVYWNSQQTACRNCHGENAEGAFGPDLAGRGLNAAQVYRAAHQPWGIMPAFVDRQLNQQQAADLAAYFGSLPKPAEPGTWRVEAPAGAPPGLVALVNLGCAQCHGENFLGPRINLAAVNADFEHFKELVYHHTTALPAERAELGAPNAGAVPHMGNFNPNRVNDSALRAIYDWAHDDLGWRAPLQARLSAGTPAANGFSYALRVTNIGLPGKGLSAEGVTIRMLIPAGVNVVAATGDGYQGVHMDPQAKANFVEWKLASIAPKEQQSYTITLSKEVTAADFKGQIRWTKPGPNNGPSNDVLDIAIRTGGPGQ